MVSRAAAYQPILCQRAHLEATSFTLPFFTLKCWEFFVTIKYFLGTLYKGNSFVVLFEILFTLI